MHVVWISIAAPAEAPDGVLASNLASVRYRMLLPKLELERLGHRVSIVDPRAPHVASIVEKADAVVFGKLMSPAGKSDFVATAQSYARLLARLGAARSIFDINDDYFNVPGYADFYRGHHPNAWTTSTNAMAEVLAEFAAEPVTVVPEPFEGPRGSPRAPAHGLPGALGLLQRALLPARRVALLWFGHPTSLPELVASLPEMQRGCRGFALHLRCLTAPGYGAEQLCDQYSRREANGGFGMSFETWSPAATWRALQDCDLVILPAKLTRQLARAKSANRLIEALRAGRCAIAHPRPAYLELRDYAWVGESLGEGIAWALRNPRQALDRTANGQRHAEAEYSPAAIAQKWLGAFRAAGAANG